MKDRNWLVPSIGLTLASGLLGLIMIPDRSGVLPAVAILPWWMVAAAMLGSICGFFAMMLTGVESPVARTAQFFTKEWRIALLLTFGMFLAGLNMTTFMWVKPLLNYLVPFWADPLLADIDQALFLGHDPWGLLTWLNSTPTAIFYHRGWFALMIITLLTVLVSPPSPEKSALMLTYFMLWSVLGPLIHILLPAGGPVFYAQLGYGDRFADLQGAEETRILANYLWTVYSGKGFGPGSGISAMPSLHIATSVWMLLVVHVCARRWIVPMAVAGALIFLLSISLGWHYAVDGVVGGAAALLCFRLLRIAYSARTSWRPAAALAA